MFGMRHGRHGHHNTGHHNTGHHSGGHSDRHGGRHHGPRYDAQRDNGTGRDEAQASCGERFAAGRGWRHRLGEEGGRGRHGMGGENMGGGRMGGGGMRSGRVLGQGDLQLIALALIAEQPRHGYEIIKLLEEKTDGWYAPSPGIVYPTLTYLEEAGYVTGQADGAKKLFTITDTGRAHLEENRAYVDAVLARLALIGEKVARMRRRMGDEERDARVPPLVKAALDNLLAVAAERVKADPALETKLVEILARTGDDLRRAGQN